MPVSESQWVFDAAEQSYRIRLLLAGFVMVLSILCLVTKKIVWIDKSGTETNQRPFGIIGLIIVSIIVAISYYQVAQRRLLKAHATETIGVTEFGGFNDKTRSFAFLYIANGVTRRGKYVEGIDDSFQHRGGKYIVIYNNEDPSDAFMDGRRPVTDSLPKLLR